VFVEGDDAPTVPQSARPTPNRAGLHSAHAHRRRCRSRAHQRDRPELGLDFVELGLIYGIDVDARPVHVTFTLTTPACPIGPQVSEQIEEFVGELDGVDEVTSSMVFTPPWSPDKMSEDAKFALGY
jgi:metal-sulfur cluster biosynthetic enzyme